MFLDCHDVQSTFTSIARAIQKPESALERLLNKYDEERFKDPSEDPLLRMPREVLAAFGMTTFTVAACFEGAMYFHGSRVFDCKSYYQRGILPLDQMLDELWSRLHCLVANDISEEGWKRFRLTLENGIDEQQGFAYRHKITSGVDRGPFGNVIREDFLDPAATGLHDYLGCPEIIQDIARPFHSAYGVDLEQRFCEAARACIVKFMSTQVEEGGIRSALWYAYSRVRHGELSSNSHWSFDGEGLAVPPSDIAGVEVL